MPSFCGLRCHIYVRSGRNWKLLRENAKREDEDNRVVMSNIVVTDKQQFAIKLVCEEFIHSYIQPCVSFNNEPQIDRINPTAYSKESSKREWPYFFMDSCEYQDTDGNWWSKGFIFAKPTESTNMPETIKIDVYKCNKEKDIPQSSDQAVQKDCGGIRLGGRKEAKGRKKSGSCKISIDPDFDEPAYASFIFKCHFPDVRKRTNRIQRSDPAINNQRNPPRVIVLQEPYSETPEAMINSPGTEDEDSDSCSTDTTAEAQNSHSTDLAVSTGLRSGDNQPHIKSEATDVDLGNHRRFSLPRRTPDEPTPEHVPQDMQHDMGLNRPAPREHEGVTPVVDTLWRRRIMALEERVRKLEDSRNNA